MFTERISGQLRGTRPEVVAGDQNRVLEHESEEAHCSSRGREESWGRGNRARLAQASVLRGPAVGTSQQWPSRLRPGVSPGWGWGRPSDTVLRNLGVSASPRPALSRNLRLVLAQRIHR